MYYHLVVKTKSEPGILSREFLCGYSKPTAEGWYSYTPHEKQDKYMYIEELPHRELFEKNNKGYILCPKCENHEDFGLYVLQSYAHQNDRATIDYDKLNEQLKNIKIKFETDISNQLYKTSTDEPEVNFAYVLNTKGKKNET